MLRLWLVLSFSIAATYSVYIGVSGVLLCTNPFNNAATVFIMERDFGQKQCLSLSLSENKINGSYIPYKPIPFPWLRGATFISETIFSKDIAIEHKGSIQNKTIIIYCSPNIAIFDVVDDDDVLAQQEVSMNEPFELGGNDFELNGIEPYIYLRYNCHEGYQEEVINLGDTQFRDRTFYLRKDLDTGETVLL